MHRVLVTATLMAVSAIVVYAAVPFGVSPRTYPSRVAPAARRRMRAEHRVPRA